MVQFTGLLFILLKAIILFIAIVCTISIVDKTIENILRYTKISSSEFEAKDKINGITVIPISGTAVVILFWCVFYVLSNL
jgi:uncharacterized BrkB/YihY/UPF0761 family membrane protein